MTCPKCGHERGTDERAPAWQCPACGIAYDKLGSKRAATVIPTERTSVPGMTASSGGFRKFRIALLLIILAAVALDSWLTVLRSTDWTEPLWVVVYPINLDQGAGVSSYLRTLDDAGFASIQHYFSQQIRRYGVPLKHPLQVRLGPELTQSPPLPPRPGELLATMLWSLKLRYWAAVNDAYEGPRPDIRVFALYYPAEAGRRLAHSTGLQKGMVSVVHVFAAAEMEGSNNVVIAHEVLHTLGATDKYDLASGQPIFPQGYAEPERAPLLPQRYAEIMGAYIPESETQANMPTHLSQTLVGAHTALEIGWRAAP